jgi:hypothetical protein
MSDNERTEWRAISPAISSEDGLYVELLVRSGREQVGLLDTIPFERITSLLGTVSRLVGDALEKANPSKASAELGVEFGLQEGKLVALIARGTGKANLKIKLEWDRKAGLTALS